MKDLLEIDRLKIDLNSTCSDFLNLNVKNVNVDLDSVRHLEVESFCDLLETYIKSTSKLNAYELVTKNASVEISSIAFAKINISDDLSIQASSMPKVFY